MNGANALVSLRNFVYRFEGVSGKIVLIKNAQLITSINTVWFRFVFFFIILIICARALSCSTMWNIKFWKICVHLFISSIIAPFWLWRCNYIFYFMQLNVKHWKRSAIQFYDPILETRSFICAIAATIIITPSCRSRIIWWKGAFHVLASAPEQWETSRQNELLP